jgi:hypothetical protein
VNWASVRCDGGCSAAASSLARTGSITVARSPHVACGGVGRCVLRLLVMCRVAGTRVLQCGAEEGHEGETPGDDLRPDRIEDDAFFGGTPMPTQLDRVRPIPCEDRVELLRALLRHLLFEVAEAAFHRCHDVIRSSKCWSR